MEFGHFYASVRTRRQTEDVPSAYGNADVRPDFAKNPVQSPAIDMQHEFLADPDIMQLNLVTQSEMRGSPLQIRSDDMYVIAIDIGKIVGLDAQNSFDASEKMK